VDQVSFQIIDTKMHGADGVTGAFLVEGRQRALIEAGPGSSQPSPASRIMGPRLWTGSS
jgi:hypothetical protein